MKKYLKTLTNPIQDKEYNVTDEFSYSFDLVIERALDGDDKGTTETTFTVFHTPWKFATRGTMERERADICQAFDVKELDVKKRDTD